MARHTVTVADAEVHLTPTEFSLLGTLATNRGRLLTHRELLSAVWGQSYADDTQVLRAHIANLRRKIEPVDAAADQRLIRTESGSATASRPDPKRLVPQTSRPFRTRQAGIWPPMLTVRSAGRPNSSATPAAFRAMVRNSFSCHLGISGSSPGTTVMAEMK